MLAVSVKRPHICMLPSVPVRPGKQGSQGHIRQGVEAHVGAVQEEVFGHGVGYGDAESPGVLGRGHPVGRVFHDKGVARHGLQSGSGEQVQLWVGLHPGHVFGALDRIEVMQQPTALQVAVYPGVVGTGGDSQPQPQELGLVDIVHHSGQQRVELDDLHVPAPSLHHQGVTVERLARQFL